MEELYLPVLARCPAFEKSNGHFTRREEDPWIPILGDPGAVSRAGRKGATTVFKHRRKSAWVPDSRRTISKRLSECWLLIGHKKCFVLLCPTGEQHLLSSFREFVHDAYWLDHGLSATRKLQTLFQKYKLELTTGIHACIDQAFVNIREFNMPRQLTTTKTSHEEWTHIFSVSFVIIPTHLLCQMQAHSSGAEFLSTISKFIKRENILSLLVYVLHKTWN